MVGKFFIAVVILLCLGVLISALQIHYSRLYEVRVKNCLAVLNKLGFEPNKTYTVVEQGGSKFSIHCFVYGYSEKIRKPYFKFYVQKRSGELTEQAVKPIAIYNIFTNKTNVISSI